MRMLNIACGDRYHRDWVNIDFHPASKGIIRVNILKGLPFENESFDVVYSSHFLEHLNQEQADFVLREAYRVLKQGGIVRVVVPDLENICREYLNILENVCKDENYAEKYQWITVELLDQLVRTTPGGLMAKIYREVQETKNKNLAEYILLRVGEDLLKRKSSNNENIINRISFAKLKNKLLYIYLNFLSFLVPKDLRDLVFVKTSIGERHQWMYDRYSLKDKLMKAGFRDIKVLDYNTSQIPNFNKYLLDINEDGSPRKGVSSLYMEGIK